MTDTSLYHNQNQSKIIGERIRLSRQLAKKSLDKNLYSGSLDEFLKMREYSITLEDLYELARKKAQEVLPTIEKLVKKTGINIFNTHLLEAIREYITVYIPFSKHDKTYKQKIENLEKGLEQLLKPDVRDRLSKLYWDVYSGKYLPEVNFYLKQIEKYLEDSTDLGLDWKIKWYALANAASNYLFSHVRCLLSNPDGYIQHMKAGDLKAYVRESCKPY